MSPLLPTELCVALAPGRIEITRRAYGLRRRVEAWHRADLTPASGDNGGWRFVLDALAEMLGGERLVRGRLKVVLSSHWVNFQVVPWNAEIASPDEFALYVRACFERVHGEIVRDWEICYDESGPGQARVACAVDRELLDGIGRVARGAGCRLHGVQPYLMHAFNPLASPLGRRRFLFVLAEPGRVTLAAADRGHWTSVSNAPLPDGVEALHSVVGRELQLLGTDEPTEILLHAPRVDEIALDAEAAGWRVVPTLGGRDYAMAWGTRAE